VLSDYLWARAVLLVGEPARPACESAVVKMQSFCLGVVSDHTGCGARSPAGPWLSHQVAAGHARRRSARISTDAAPACRAGPTVATVGLSAQVPLAVLLDLIFTHPAWLRSAAAAALMVLGAALVLAGFFGVAS